MYRDWPPSWIARASFISTPTPSDCRLWLPGNADPAVHRIEVKHRQLAFDLRGQSYIQLVGLKVFRGLVDDGRGLLQRHRSLSV